jgi:hypothetical protein
MRLAFALLIFLSAASVGAQDNPPKPAPAAPAEASIQGYGDREKTCLEWNDGCRTCRRDGAKVSCSNIGIACQPTPIACTWPDPPKPPDPPK